MPFFDPERHCCLSAVVGPTNEDAVQEGLGTQRLEDELGSGALNDSDKGVSPRWLSDGQDLPCAPVIADGTRQGHMRPLNPLGSSKSVPYHRTDTLKARLRLRCQEDAIEAR